MGTGTLRLRGSSLLDRAKSNKGVENKHQLSYEARVAYNTILKYFDEDGMKALDLRVLCTLLIQGIGFTPEELMNVKFGDIFEYIENYQDGAAD